MTDKPKYKVLHTTPIIGADGRRDGYELLAVYLYDRIEDAIQKRDKLSPMEKGGLLFGAAWEGIKEKLRINYDGPRFSGQVVAFITQQSLTL